MKGLRRTKRWLAMLLAFTLAFSNVAYVDVPAVVFAEEENPETLEVPSETPVTEETPSEEEAPGGAPEQTQEETVPTETPTTPPEETPQEPEQTVETSTEAPTDGELTEEPKDEIEEPEEEKATYQVTFNYNAEEGSVEAKEFSGNSGTVEEKTSVNFTVTPNQGYKVDAVKSEGNEITFEYGTYILKDVVADTEVVVTFTAEAEETDDSEENSDDEESDLQEPEKAEEYTISYIAMGPGKVSLAEETVSAEDKANGSTATAEDGYELLGWFTDEDRDELVQTEATLVPEVKGNATYYAFFGPSAEVIPEEENAEVVTYEFYVGNDLIDTKEFKDRDELTLPTEPAAEDGKSFAGWFVGAEELKAGTTITVTDENKGQTIEANARFEDWTVTYKFFADGKELKTWEQELVNGDTVQLPGAPAGTNKTFAGWFVGAEELTEGTVAVVTVENKGSIIDVEARFDDVWHVVFQDGTRVLNTVKVPKENGFLTVEDFQTARDNYESSADKKLLGWSTTKGSETADFNVETKITADITVYPVTKENIWVSFNSKGGSTVSRVAVGEDGKIVKPADPTRAGYAFKGWVDASNKTVDFQTREFKDNTTLYADWTGKQVEYTIIYWKENANYQNNYLSADKQDAEQYSYSSSETRTAVAGTKVTKSIVNPKAADDGFDAPNVEEKIVSGDGSTIVNVYYDRQEYTLIFKHTEKNKPNITITAKYQANIKDAWPVNCQGDTRWQCDHKGTTYIRTFMETMPLNGKFDGDSGTYTEPSSKGIYKLIRNFYVEVLSGDKVDVTIGGKGYKKYNTITTPSNQKNTLAAWIPLDGYVINSVISTQGNYSWKNFTGTANGYYDRVSYEIVFVSKGKEVGKVSKKYEENIGIDSGSYSYGDSTGFEGWFLDESFMKSAEATLNGNMPAKSITVYAKWSVPQYKVRIYASDKLNDDIDPFEVDAGSYLTEAELNEKAGISDRVADPEEGFLGWYVVNSDGTIGSGFDFSSPVTSDTTLCARWKGETYNVIYVIGEGAEGTVPVDNASYTENSNAKVLSGEGLTLNGEEFECWSDGTNTYKANEIVHVGNSDVTLTAQYKIPRYSVTVTYVYHEADGEPKPELPAPVVQRDLIPIIGSYRIESPVLNGFVADQTVVQGTIGLRSLNITVTYHKDTYNNGTPDCKENKELSYTVQYYKDRKLADTETVKKTVKGTQPNTLAVDKTEINTADKYPGYKCVGTDPKEIPDTVNDGDVIKVYYEKKTDLSYVVNYLEKDTDKVLSTQKTVGDQTFGSTATETAIDITGYDKVVPTEKSITIGAEGNEITFYYTKRTDLSYVVNYLEKDTDKVLSTQKTVGDQTFGSTATETAIDITGYDKVVPTEKSITIGAEGNEITFYYTKRTDLSYVVNYLEKDTDKVLSTQKTVGDQTFGSTATETAIDITGYDKVVPTEKSITIGAEGNEITFYYTKRTDLSYVVNYLEKDTDKVLSTQKTVGDQTFGSTATETAIDITGYDKVVPTEKSITIGAEGNEIIFYYTKRTDLSYVVNYLEKDTDKVLSTQKTVGDQTFGSTATETAIDITGYDKVVPTEKSITIGAEGNEITFYYTKRTDLSYVVNYLEKDTDKVLSTQKTVGDQTFGSTATETAIDITGYDKVVPTEKSITIGAEGNEITFYYTKRTDLSYVVNYLEKDTDKVLSTQKTVGDQTFGSTATETAIDITGYDKVVPTEKSITIGAEGNEIIFYYTKRTDLSYVVNYLEKDTDKVLSTQKTVGDQTFGSTATETAIDITGYDKVVPTEKSITIGAEGNEITFYYTKRTDLSYVVNYLEKDTDKVLSTQKTVGDQTFGSTATETAIDITGYDKVVPTEKSITIGAEGNEITFYYTKRTDLSYVVNYLEKDTDKVLSTQKTVGDQTFGSTATETAIDITGYDKVVPTEKSITIGAEGNEITFYYTKRTDLSYVVNYLEKDTDKVLSTQKTVGDQTFGSTATETAIDITGYDKVVPTEKSITIGAEGNEITFYYTKRTDLSYVVNYLEKDTDKVLSTQKTVGDQTFGSTATETAIDITGYDKVVPTEKSITIGAEGNEITFYYTKRTDLSYVVNYLEKDTDKVLSTQKTVGDQTFGSTATETAIDITGYDKVVPTEKSITIGAEGNEITFYYTKRTDLSYMVNYINEKTGEPIQEAKTIINKTFGEIISSADEKINIEGYAFIRADKESITIGTGTNVINLYYGPDKINKDKPEEEGPDGIPDKYQAKVKFVIVNGTWVVDETRDDTSHTKVLSWKSIDENGNLQDESPVFKVIVPKDMQGKEGYTIDKGWDVQPVATNVKLGETNVFTYTYEKGNFDYTIHYFYDDKEDAGKLVEGSALFESTIDQYVDKSEKGYAFDYVENFPLTIGVEADKNVINVYYAKDVIGTDPKNPDEGDGIPDKYQAKITYEIENGTWDGKEDKASKTEVITLKEKDPETGKWNDTGATPHVPEGMQPDTGYTGGKWNPEPVVTDGGEYTFTYSYVKDAFGYTVEYYYNGVKDDSKTDSNTADFETVISTYTDKNLDGYILYNTENLPLTVSEVAGNNVIKVYYEKDTMSDPDEDKDDDPDNGDGIPDRFQVEVRFEVVNGKWTESGESEGITRVVTLKKDGKPSEDGTATLSPDQIPGSERKSSKYQKTGKWDSDPSTAVITGAMTFTITYSPVPNVPTTDPTPDPTPTPDPGPGPDPTPDPTPAPTPDPAPVTPPAPAVVPTPAPAPAAPAGAAAPAAPVVAVQDDEVPLANIDLGEEDGEEPVGVEELVGIEEKEVPLANEDIHDCCIFHFMEMLLAIIILAWYTHNSKKRQKRIFELREQLAVEQVNRGITPQNYSAR